MAIKRSTRPGSMMDFVCTESSSSVGTRLYIVYTLLAAYELFCDLAIAAKAGPD